MSKLSDSMPTSADSMPKSAFGYGPLQHFITLSIILSLLVSMSVNTGYDYVPLVIG